MGKELVFLGNDGADVRLALIDLSELRYGYVPVKKVPRAEFKKLCTQVRVRGYVEGSANITDSTYVRVAHIPAKLLDTPSGHKPEGVEVFIRGDGLVRCLHPVFLKYVNGFNAHTFVLRQNVVELPITALVTEALDYAEVYSEFDCLPVEKAEAFMQVLLSYGLYSDYREPKVLHVYPLDLNTYNATNLYPVKLNSLRVPDCCGNVILHYIDMQVTDVYAYGNTFFTLVFYAAGHTAENEARLRIGVLHANLTTNISAFGVEVGKIVGTATDKCIRSGEIRGLDTYTGPDMLKDVGRLTLSNCFNSNEDEGEVLEIESDVYLPLDTEYTCCFESVVIKGDVRIGKAVRLTRCFGSTEMRSVLFEGDLPLLARHYYESIKYSFNESKILGDVDAQYIDNFVHSFVDCDLRGSLKTSNAIFSLERECFKGLDGLELNMESGNHSFKANLLNEKATLNVTGNSGTFAHVFVGKLNWHTTLENVQADMFYQAKSSVSNEVTTVKTISKNAYREFAGRKLDLSPYTALELLSSRAVTGCPDLTVAVVEGPVVLEPSAFSKCPKLAHIYIGDEVSKVPASAFDNLAPTVHIYYSKNTAVEKLRKIPRFVFHPDATPEDALCVLDVRSDMLETASVLATFAGLSSEGYSQEHTSTLHAVELSLNETGVCSSLAELYPVKEMCSVPISSVVWASEASRAKVVTTVHTEAVRTLVACVTQTYPYNESVLKYAAGSGEVLLESADYAFISLQLTISGVATYIGAILDKTVRNIIHAYTIGPKRNEIAEIARYFNYMSDVAESCAILRYTGEIDLMEFDNGSILREREFTPELRKRIHDAVLASYVPFGSFKLGSTYGWYGIDLYSGNCVVYPYKSVSALTVTSNLIYVTDFWKHRLKLKGHIYESGLSNIGKPLLAGNADVEVAKLVNLGALLAVTDFDTAVLPLARDKQKASELLALIKERNFSSTVLSVLGLLQWSELFQKDSKLGQVDGRKFLRHSVALVDGSVDFYEYNNAQHMAVKLSDSSGSCTWYACVCRLDFLCDLLTDVVEHKGDLVHAILTEQAVKKKVHYLTSLKFYTNTLANIENSTNTLCLGVCTETMKACLYVNQFVYTDSEKATLVLFWFNTLKDAYKAAIELGFNPFAAVTQMPKARNRMGDYELGFNGVLKDEVLSATKAAIMFGKPDGYVSSGSRFNQKIFDLACKQPHVI